MRPFLDDPFLDDPFLDDPFLDDQLQVTKITALRR